MLEFSLYSDIIQDSFLAYFLKVLYFNIFLS